MAGNPAEGGSKPKHDGDELGEDYSFDLEKYLLEEDDIFKGEFDDAVVKEAPADANQQDDDDFFNLDRERAQMMERRQREILEGLGLNPDDGSFPVEGADGQPPATPDAGSTSELQERPGLPPSGSDDTSQHPER